MKSRDLEILASKTAQHDQTLQQQDAESAELENDIAEVTQRKEQAASQLTSLQSQIATLKSEIAARQVAQSAHAQDLNAQARLNLPELDFWESNLGMRIEGVKDDRLRFVFVNLDERNWAREAWFDLDMEKRQYAIIEYRPKIEDSMVDSCLDGLNASRDLGKFLKGMRAIFRNAMQSPTSQD